MEQNRKSIKRVKLFSREAKIEKPRSQDAKKPGVIRDTPLPTNRAVPQLLTPWLLGFSREQLDSLDRLSILGAMAVKVGTKRRDKTTRTIAEEPRLLNVAVVEEEEISPPAVSPRVRIAPERGGVAIWSQMLFNDSATHHLRLFLSRVFSLQEISVVEVDRRAGVGRVKYELTKDAPSIWRKLKQVLTQRTTVDLDDELRSEYGAAPLGVDRLYLDMPATLPIRIGRIGSYLSTWRLRNQTEDRVRLTHPILRNRKDVAYRLEEELTAILGVRSFRTNIMASSVMVRFNTRRIWMAWKGRLPARVFSLLPR
jgi:hypothetical protein